MERPTWAKLAIINLKGNDFNWLLRKAGSKSCDGREKGLSVKLVHPRGGKTANLRSSVEQGHAATLGRWLNISAASTWELVKPGILNTDGLAASPPVDTATASYCQYSSFQRSVK
jgi:hypothetical protein